MKRNVLVAAIALLGIVGLIQPAAAHDSLYKRLGGYDAIAAVVDDFIGRMASDPQLQPFFAGHSTESLQRIPGIHTEGFRGEPRYITIRGAAPNLNSVTLDGVSLLGTEADLRTVSLDVFSSSQLSSIEVVKAITADMDADSIGGAVVLKGRSAFDTGRRTITAGAHLTYNDLAELMVLAQAGKVELHTKTYPLSSALDAFRDLDAGQVRGRAILVP